MKPTLQILWGLFLLVIAQIAQSQSVTVTVAVPPPYPIHVDDYLSYRTQSVITLTNTTDNPLQVKLISSVTNAFAGLSAKVKTSFQPAIPILLAPRETKVLSGKQLENINANLTPNDVENQGFDVDQVIRTGQLPEGSYLLCIRAHDYQTSAPLSNEMMGCTPLNLTWYDPPILIQPTNESQVNATSPPFLNFIWTPAGLPGKTRYELRMVDMTVTGLFNPNDAFSGIVLPFFQKINLLQNSYQYGVADLLLQNNHQYAVEVVAYDPTNSISFKNGGRSAVSTFTWKKQNIIIDPNIVLNNPPNNGGNNGNVNNPNLNLQNNPPPIIFNMMTCQQEVNIPNPTPINGNGIIGVNDVLNIGGHELLLTEATWNGKNLSGKGKIKNSWFKIPILVEFEGLQVNSDKVVLDGVAKARDDNNSPLEWLNDLGNISISEAEIQKAISKLLGQSNERIVEWPNTKNIGVGMPVGIKRNIGGAEQIIAIVGMHFGVGGAALNAVAQVNIPSSGQKLLFGAAGVCFDAGGLTKDAFLFLGEDYTVNPNGAISMALKKGNPDDPSQGTFITMESQGFKNLQLDGALVLDNKKVKPIDKNLTKVQAPFKVFVENFHNFLLDNISLTPFEVVGLPGFEMTVTGISYDHSELANPQGITFPTQGYNNEGNLWQGFYFKTLKIKLPQKLNTDTEFSATDMVFDKSGFSGILSAPVVFGKEKGKMGEKKWPFSMEDLYVRVIKNSLEEGRFKGKIRVPITKDDFYFDYKATLSYANDLKYQFKLQPVEDVDFPAVIAKGKIFNNTHIVVEDVGNGFEPAFHLYGLLTLNTKLGANVQGYDLSFEGVEVQNLVVDKTGIHLGENGAVKYNSPQKSLAGFDVSISDCEIGLNSIGFAIGIDFTEKENNVVGGKSAVNILCKWDGSMLKFDKFQLESIDIHGDMSIVKVDGSVEFYHDDEVYGNGFKGDLKASIMLGEGGAGLGTELALLIGKKKNNNLKYFYFDGSVELPDPASIPLSASMRLFGFRGGVYHHMKRVNGKYIPDAETIFGVKGGVAIGLDSRKAFHAKLTLEAAFDKNGIANVFFDGDGYVFTDYQTGFEKYPGTQPVYLGVDMEFDFKKKIFNLLAHADVQYPIQQPVLNGGGDMQIYVAGKTDWFVKVGTPQNRVNLNVLNLYNAGHYFMAGYGLGGLPEPPELVKQVCKIQSMPDQRNYGQLQGEGDPQSLGFALGSEYSGGSTGDLEWWIFYAKLAYTAGFDVMLYNQAKCPGINGWYALGQAYFAFDGGVGLKFQLTPKSKVRKIELLEAQFGALAQAGLANPFWFTGTIHGEATLLGIFEGGFHYEVHYGEKCMGTPDYKEIKPLDGLAFIKDTNPDDGDKGVSVFAQPEVAFTFSTDKVYELKEQDTEGNVTSRFFKFPLKQMYLKEDAPNGKTFANINGAGLPGEFKKNPNGDVYTYKSKEAFPGSKKLEWFIELDILEKINGQFKPATGEGSITETILFTTGQAPKTIEPGNVAFCYPERGQRYYLQNDNVRKGYIQVKVNAYDDLFDLTPPNQFATPDKIRVKFIPIGGGQTLEGQYLKYEDNRVHFSHPPLLNNRIYVAQFIKILSPQSVLANTPNNNGMAVQNLGVNPDLVTQMTEQQQVLGELKLEAREYEIFKYVFRTSAYNSLEAKLVDFKNGSVDNAGGNAPTASRTVTVKAKEPFDKADQLFLTFDWSLGFGFGGQGQGGNGQGGNGISNYKPNFYWKDYLDPKIYHAYNDVLVPIAYPGSQAISPSVYMQLQNADPLLSQSEINNALNQLANPNPGLVFTSNPVPKDMKFTLYGESIGHYAYKYLLMPKLFNIANPQIKACLFNNGPCNPNLKQLMNYHLANPQFKTLKGGTYQTLAGYNAFYVKGMTGDNRQAFDWKKEFGLGN